MTQKPYLLDAIRREIVLTSLQQVCLHRDWTLLAAHVRTNHVHVVVAAPQTAEQVMNAFKAYASRALNERALEEGRAQALGPTRKYTIPLDEGSRVGRSSLCGLRARGANGFFRNADHSLTRVVL